MKKTDFKPAWWLPSPHLQTMWPALFRKRHKLPLLTEQVELDDGDFIDLCWSETPVDHTETSKTVLLIHGLEGSLSSHYANGLMFQLQQSGYRPVFMYFRGCSGRSNRLARSYHSGETADLAFIVEHINKKTGFYPCAAVGFSLGGNVLLKWLGESGDRNPLKSAVAVSVPFSLIDAALRLQSGLSRIYRNYLLSSLRAAYKKKFASIDSPLSVDVNELQSFWEYDDKVTAPLHGFSGAQDYYERCSSRQFLQAIRIPTRIIHSSDDPFMFASTIPEDQELNGCIDFLLTDKGGHVGFVSARTPFTADYWCERKIIEFISEHC